MIDKGMMLKSYLGNSFYGTDVAFFLQDLDGGGAERAIVALAGEIANRGHRVDLVVGDADSDYRFEVSKSVCIKNFATRSPWMVLARLTVYLRRHNPIAVMSALDVPNIMLVFAATLAGYKGRIIISQRAVIDASQWDLPPIRRKITQCLQRVCFLRANALISNSNAAASELHTLLGIPAERVFTIHNALDMDRINRLSGESLNDNWFLSSQCPLIVSVGSLTPRKDIETLIRAFSFVKSKREVRLAIIGKEQQLAVRQTLENLIAELGLSESVYLAGFDSNPYKWMAAAAVFVSSSTAEGFPNVVAEALALGRAIVATDCPGDTAEILQHGKWGRLVPVGDPERMAKAIVAALDDVNLPYGQIRAMEFSPERAVDAYLSVLLPDEIALAVE